MFVPPPLPSPKGRLRVQLVLLALTVITTTMVGAEHYLSFRIGFENLPALLAGDRSVVRPLLAQPGFYLNGLWYSVTILAILGCHELGHYVACLRYGVAATRPYFLPLPPSPLTPLTGTLGAFIRIKSRIPHRIALFDIGIAGPIAGFVVALPAVFAGMWLSTVERIPPDVPFSVSLGEPLLFQAAQWLVWGRIADGYGLNMHPVAFGAWFGLLATALNLFPIAQLDGGHIAFAVFGRKSVLITYLMIAVAVALAFFSLSWIVWTILMLLMLLLVGPHHPPTLNDDISLARGRLLLAAGAVVIWIVCFTPAPISPWEPAESEHRERVDVDRDALHQLRVTRYG
jgi:membrane-associated protease RseP (regulator of RpoE activity)